MSKLVHLHLKEPYQGAVEKFKGKLDLYFGSYAAIFEHLTDAKEATGISRFYLSEQCRFGKGHFENKRCIVRVEEVYHINRKKQCSEQ